MKNKLLEYFKGDELASNVFKSKYAQEGDVTPDDMHKRMASEFARIENNYKNKLFLNCFVDYNYDNDDMEFYRDYNLKNVDNRKI